MHRTKVCGLLLLLAAALVSAENTPSWKTRPIGQWDTEDARQVLADSPWVGRAILQTIRDRSPAERRDSGDWDTGIGPGVGLAALALFDSPSVEEAIARAHFKIGRASCR